MPKTKGKRSYRARIIGGVPAPIYMEPSETAHNILAIATARGYLQKSFIEQALEEKYVRDVEKGLLPANSGVLVAMPA